ncbi:MAG: hypothetical protein BWX95_00879 [Bacteroidetes bacterium ADurb.Bin141]|nr:MAG: hypothetical protein BWX95_00879 [Bacteroidetes bacterium ADurb.Bin141]
MWKDFSDRIIVEIIFYNSIQAALIFMIFIRLTVTVEKSSTFMLI